MTTDNESDKLIDLGEMANAELLPAVIGFTNDHNIIITQLIRRAVVHMQGKTESKSYGINENVYSGGIEETVTLVNGNTKLRIVLETAK